MALVAVPPTGRRCRSLDARGQLESAALEHRRGDEAGGLTGIRCGRSDSAGLTKARPALTSLAAPWPSVAGGRWATRRRSGQRGGPVHAPRRARPPGAWSALAVVHLSGVRRGSGACARQIGDFRDMQVVSHHSRELQQRGSDFTMDRAFSSASRQRISRDASPHRSQVDAQLNGPSAGQLLVLGGRSGHCPPATATGGWGQTHRPKLW